MNTFEELLSITTKAVRDGVISSYTVNDMDYSDRIGNALYLGCNMTNHAISNEINFIKSLYTETFVIESQSDLSKIRLNNKKTKVVLANRELVTDEIWDHLKDISGEAQLKLLKGATVTQEK